LLYIDNKLWCYTHVSKPLCTFA